MINENFGNYFAGLCDGEGSFGVYKQKHGSINHYFPRFTIHLRIDDLPVLQYIKDNIGVGRIRYVKEKMFIQNDKDYKSNPNVFYYVNVNKDLHRIIDVLDICILRSKKVNEYKIWRQVVFMKEKRNNATNPFLEYAYFELNKLKKFDIEYVNRIINV